MSVEAGTGEGAAFDASVAVVETLPNCEAETAELEMES